MSSVALEGELYAAVMLIRLNAGPDFPSEKAMARIRSSLGKRGLQAKSVEAIKGVQKGIWGLFEGIVAVSWTCPGDDEKRRGLIMEEAATVEKASADFWEAEGGKPDGVSFVFHEGKLDGGERAKAGWTTLLGEALARQNAAGRTKT